MIKRCDVCRYWSAGNTDRKTGTCDRLIRMSDHSLELPTGETVHVYTETRVETIKSHVCINFAEQL